MNTKGIKFLAVLAVMVMAFAAIVALAPADKDTEAVIVYGNNAVIVDPMVIDGTEEDVNGNPVSEFYISEDAVVKIKGLRDGGATFYVQNGKELELNIKTELKAAADITIFSVTADQQRTTTSTVDPADKKSNGENDTVPGKIKIIDTEVKFSVAAKVVNQSVVYTAMMPYSVVTETTSGSNIKTDVWTYDNYGTQSTTQRFATISSDGVLDGNINKYVTVAPGQAIQTALPVDVDYGIMTNVAGEITYYARGMNAGAVTVETANDKVIVKNGTVAVSTPDNSASIKATSAKGGVTLKGAADHITVSESLTAGSMTVSGNVEFASKFKNGATVTLNSNATVLAGSVMNITGTLVLKNDREKAEKLDIQGTGTVIALNEKLWKYNGTKPYLVFANAGEWGADEDFKGQYDVKEITKVAEVKDAFSTALIEKNQTFVVVSDTIVTTALNVEGVLIIQPGVTLTISKINGIGATVTALGQYAQIVNYGDILIQSTAPEQDPTVQAKADPYGLHVYGGLLLNEGKIVGSSDSKALAAGGATFCVEFQTVGEAKGFGAGFTNNGTITTSRNDRVSLDDKFTNNGSVSINGALVSSGLKNKGVFTLNNAKVESAGLTVSMSKGAVFTIGSAEVEQNAKIVVKNSNDTITFQVPDVSGKWTLRGITVTDVSVGKFTSLDISGTFALTKPTATTPDDVIVTAEGSIDVTGTATVGKGYILKFPGTSLEVYGTLTLSKDAVVDDVTGLTLYSFGKVVCVDKDHFSALAEANYIAAKYEAGNNTIYAKLEDAVPAAIEADQTMITVGGTKDNYVTVYDDILVPTGMTITGQYLAVDGEAAIIVAEDAMFSFEKIVVKNGLISAADANNINIQSVEADVIEQEEGSTAADCMSLEVALKLATPGKVIELNQNFFAADTEIVIPEGVVVDATAATDATDFVLVNSNLVVNGVLVVDVFKFIATTDDTIGITLNGYIYDSCPNTAWPNGCFRGWWYTPFGVGSYVTDENDQTWYVLTNIAYIQESINQADDAKVWVEGDAVLDELNLSGRDDMPAEVIFTGNVDVDNININDTTLKFTKGKKITTTVSDALGSITVTGAYAGEKMSIYSMDDAGVYLAGEVTDGADGTYSIRFDGITGMDGTTRSAINWTSKTEMPTILFAGETTVKGKKAYIQFDDEQKAVGMVTIIGALVADNNAKIIINSEVQILGGLVAAERTEESVAGTVEVNGNVFVGALKSDLYNAQDAINAYKADSDFAGYKEAPGADYGEQLMTAAAAAVSGNVVVSNGFITVLDGSEVDDAIIEDLEFLEIVIDDELWITVYGDPNALFSMDGLKAPIFNAKVTTILDAFQNPVAKYSHDFKVIYGSEAKKLSAYGEGVLISLNYDVFTVTIKTDGSVKAVYIDGILMYTGENRNTFNLYNVATGTHQVTVEAATGYDASKCNLYTDSENPVILPGMKFTFTEFDCDDYTVTYNINGTEIQPEPIPPTPEEESQWTITTILLVILVVLIAIMAVIVALRLNRS